MSAPAIVSPFSLLDGAIAVLSLLATLWIGLRVKRYIGTIEDYLVANRGMGLYVGAASLLSTEVGIITYMYQAQFGFVAGFSAFVTGLITLAVCLLVGRTGFVITRLREMEILTVPEYFETRYGRSVRVLAGVLMAFGGSLNLGIFPIIEARFLAVVTGIPSQYLGWTMAGLLLVALAYTALGGMVSLIVTNYVQYVFLAAGTVIVTLACLRHVGWSGMVGAVEGHMGGHGFEPDRGPRHRLHPVAGPPLDRAHDRLAVGGDAHVLHEGRGGREEDVHAHRLPLPGPRAHPHGLGHRALAFFWGRAEPVAAPAAADEARADGAARRAARRDLPPGPRRGTARAGAAAGGPPRAARPRGEGGGAGGGPLRGRGPRPARRDRAPGHAVDAGRDPPDRDPRPGGGGDARRVDLDLRRLLPRLELDHRAGHRGAARRRRSSPTGPGCGSPGSRSWASPSSS